MVFNAKPFAYCLEGLSKNIYFLQNYFYSLKKKLKDPEFIWWLTEQLHKGLSFSFDNVLIIKTETGWIWRADRKEGPGQPTQIIRISDFYTLLFQDELMELYSSIVHNQARDQKWNQDYFQRTGRVWKDRKEQRTGLYYQHRRNSDWHWIYAISEYGTNLLYYHDNATRRVNLTQKPSIVLQNKARIAIGRQSHGQKTVSSHYIIQQWNLAQLELDEVDPG